jgi:hypothetical protein
VDYQLVEEHGVDGRPALRLLVHPRVGALDPRAVVDAFVSEIGAASAGDRIMGMIWHDAGLITIERRPPFVATSGKILHLHSPH